MGTRRSLVSVAAGLVFVFVIAAWLNPYDAQGQPRTMATHRQLGLPPCTFYLVTGLPCPSCGMTTSFALLVHGDLRHSLQANAVGTLLALVCLAAIPWCLVCALRGRLYGIRSVERMLTGLVVVFLLLMLLRWAIVLVLMGTAGASGSAPADRGEDPVHESRRRDDGTSFTPPALGRPDPGDARGRGRLQPAHLALLPLAHRR